MKRSLAICLAITVILGVANSTLVAKEKEIAKTAATGKKFDMTGTVTKYLVGICMQSGVKYDLHPPSGPAVHLAGGHRHDLMVLEDATKTHKQVRVEGTEETATECKYVNVDKATPAPEKPKAK